MVYLLLVLFILLDIVGLGILFSFIWTALIGRVPYLSTPQERIETIIKLAHIQPGEKAVDLGSGDGRIVIALARAGAEAHGYELNLLYVVIARWNIYRAGLSGKAFIYWRNFFSADLSTYDVIVVFGVSYMMPKLQKKLQQEMKPSAKVISHSYQFTTWKPKHKEDFVFLYTK